jgi:hypothetical protein
MEQPVQGQGGTVGHRHRLEHHLDFRPRNDPARDVAMLHGAAVEEAGAKVILRPEMQHPGLILNRIEREEGVGCTATEVARETPGRGHGRC